MPEAKSAITDVKPGGRGRTSVAPAVAPAPVPAAKAPRKGKAPPLTLTQQRAAARDAVKLAKTANSDAATALKAHQKRVNDAVKAVLSKEKALALAETAKPHALKKAAVKLAKEDLKTAERTLKDLGKATPKLEAADAKAKAAYDAATAAKLKIETDRLGAA
mgnify:CR=1 FL=1